MESASIAAYVWQPSGTASNSYTPNTLNQYSAVSGTSYTYDGNGNLTADGAFTYAYDAENRLLSAVRGGLTVAYGYDPLGRRTHKSGTTSGGALWGAANWGSFNWASAPFAAYYVSSGSDEIAEYDASGALATRYVPGPAIDEPVAVVTAAGAKSYFHTNRQGSVIAMSGASAALIEGPYTYSPYGDCYIGASSTPCSSSGEPYRFTGRRLDAETGLYYYRARYYASGLGRFLQTDPVGYDVDPNLYTYVGNDPTDMTDPTGMDPSDYFPPNYYAVGPNGMFVMPKREYEGISHPKAHATIQVGVSGPGGHGHIGVGIDTQGLHPVASYGPGLNTLDLGATFSVGGGDLASSKSLDVSASPGIIGVGTSTDLETGRTTDFSISLGLDDPGGGINETTTRVFGASSSAGFSSETKKTSQRGNPPASSMQQSRQLNKGRGAAGDCGTTQECRSGSGLTIIP
jgi:RHS repeat-associated protein